MKKYYTLLIIGIIILSIGLFLAYQKGKGNEVILSMNLSNWFIYSISITGAFILGFSLVNLFPSKFQIIK